MKIWLIWKTNVGKSTLFNRLLGNYRAIVSETPGTTRELLLESITLADEKNAVLYDSPWLLDFQEELGFIKTIINESDILVFVIDGKIWMDAKDEEIKNLVLKSGKKDSTILAVNKLDKWLFLNESVLISEYYELGFDNIVWISAQKSENIDLLVQKIIDLAEDKGYEFEQKQEKNHIPLAILGRPNVGKSTLLNKLCQDEIATVSEKAGTTLDYLIWEFKYRWKDFKVYDTAGIRKKWKIHWLEKMAFEKTLKMLEFIKPLVIIMIDAVEWITHRDLSLFGDMEKLNLPMIICVNKIDMVSKKDFERDFELVRSKFDFVKRVPIIPISAKQWLALPKLLDFIAKIRDWYNFRVNTWEINKTLNTARIENPPKFPRNRICKFYYVSQVESKPPKFLFFINAKSKVNFAFKKWLENVIRKTYGFVWIPIIIDFREKKRDE
mgnify:CR=1 FL=1